MNPVIFAGFLHSPKRKVGFQIWGKECSFLIQRRLFLQEARGQSTQDRQCCVQEYHGKLNYDKHKRPEILPGVRNLGNNIDSPTDAK